MAFKGSKKKLQREEAPPASGDLLPATRFKARPRLLMAAWGIQKSGRTNFGLSAPKPMVILTSDPQGLEGVIDKLPSKVIDQIQVCDFRLDPDMVDKKERQSAALQQWEKLQRVYRDAIRRRVRSILVDNWSDLYNRRKEAEFGELAPKLGKGERMNKYGDINVDMKDLINQAVAGDSNLILIERVKKEYEDDKPTGELERVGFRDTAYEVHVNIHTEREGSQFMLTIDDCRHSPEANGMQLKGDACTFAQVATLVMPDVDEGEWE